MGIRYITGDVTEPQGEGRKLIVQVVNDCGGMGAGVALAIMRRWPIVRRAYIDWHRNGGDFGLGKNQYVDVSLIDSGELIIANMIAQHGYSYPGNPAIRYDALRECLEGAAKYARNRGMSVHCPRLGAGLAGGKWEEIEPIIQAAMPDLDVTVYDFPGDRWT